MKKLLIVVGLIIFVVVLLKFLAAIIAGVLLFLADALAIYTIYLLARPSEMNANDPERPSHLIEIFSISASVYG